MSAWRKEDGPVLRIEDLSVRFFVRHSLFSTRPIEGVLNGIRPSIGAIDGGVRLP